MTAVEAKKKSTAVARPRLMNDPALTANAEQVPFLLKWLVGILT